MITISDKAKQRAIELIAESGFTTETHFIRVGVKGGGCSGLSYDLDFDDTIKEGDQIFGDEIVRIICDKKSLLYLIGTELDYSDGLKGKGFEFNNPNAQRVCSCGESFAI